MNTTTHDAAKEYHKQGYVPVPIEPGTKECRVKKWQNLTHDNIDIDKLFPDGCTKGIGILNGKPSGGLIDIDLDCPEARHAASILLPPTDRVWGRESAPDSHYGYRVDDLPEGAAINFDGPDGEHICEIRGTGGYTVVPPTIMPDGEPCVWQSNGEPACIGFAELRQEVGKVASAVLIAKHWTVGSRHNASLALAGGLLRAGWTVENVDSFIWCICCITEDIEIDDRAQCVRSTAEKFKQGNNVFGWPTLAELIGSDVVDRVCEWLGIQWHDGTSGSFESIDDPHRLARSYLDGFQCDGVCILRWWCKDFYRWKDGGYHLYHDIEAELTRWLNREFARVRPTKADDKPTPKKKVTMTLVANVVNALHGECLVRAEQTPPCWIGDDRDTLPLLAFRNGILNLTKGTFEPPSPEFFTLNPLSFDYDPNAGQPVGWLRFLEQLWPNDPENIACLQEWFGYLLTPDTRQQKMLMLIGPKRSGKGTILRVLKELVGPGNYAGPTLASLGQDFGLSSLIGKLVAAFSDARLNGRTDTSIVVERLLSITGEDTIDINRKFKDIVAVKLPTRFVLVSNEMPKFSDASGALAGRMILLRTTESFYRNEDQGLTARLLKELPGILLWAIDGWKCLNQRGRFVQPVSSAQMMQEMEDIASPIGQFVRERCVVVVDATVPVADLYKSWQSWCSDHGRNWPGAEQSFGRDLRLYFRN